jgi:hypothetical protein
MRFCCKYSSFLTVSLSLLLDEESGFAILRNPLFIDIHPRFYVK